MSEWEPYMWPPDHRFGISVKIDGANGEDILIGTAREAADVPFLLRLVADNWKLRYPEICDTPEVGDSLGGASLGGADERPSGAG